jgi:hypothetical protein
LNRLPRKVGTRAVHTKRYEKRVPGHHIQVDVKFLIFKGKGGGAVQRYQYTAIDDATRIRALKVYSRHKTCLDLAWNSWPQSVRMIREANFGSPADV